MPRCPLQPAAALPRRHAGPGAVRGRGRGRRRLHAEGRGPRGLPAALRARGHGPLRGGQDHGAGPRRPPAGPRDQ